MHQPIHVLKLGSSVLRSEADLPVAVREVYRAWRAGHRVVAVPSAFGPTTDDLLKRAEQLGLPPQREAFATLLATGESVAASLLTLALDRSGIPVTLLDPAQIALLTQGDPLDAEPVSVDVPRLLQALAHGVVVVPGFAGRDAAGRTTLLGRGGSDLTALFLARELGASCTLLKDVDGLYTADPATGGGRRFAVASWETVRALGNGLVQPKAVRFAEAAGLGFEVAAPAAGPGTRVGPGPDRLKPPHRSRAPLRVALLGCGAVGGGVLVHLLARPHLFHVTGVLVRDTALPRDGAPRHLFTADPEALFAQEADVVVELLGGRVSARQLIVRTLERGSHVVSANKALLAAEIEPLSALAASQGVSLRYSASVGGALPALEAVSRAAMQGRVRRLVGVLNGTSSFVLDRLGVGLGLAEAVAEAQRAGFAEADPSLDLDGSDAAQKLALLARLAFGETLDWQSIKRRGIESLDTARRGGVVRLVALCERVPEGLRASVGPVELPPNDPLARTRAAGNALSVEMEDGAILELTARGAGRWPTAEAVMADLYDLAIGSSRRAAARETRCAEEVLV